MRATIARWGVACGEAAALLLILLAASACSTAPHTRYRSQTADWQRLEARSAPPRTTQPLFAGAPSLGREALVRQVLEHNPTIRAARYAWRAALARFPQVTALDDPVLGAGVAPASFGSRRVDDAARFDLSQKLPFPGKLGLRGEAALAEAEAAAHDHEAVRLRLATMASLLYDDYYLAARSLAINAEHVVLLQEFQRVATSRYEAGQASQQDPIQAEVRLTHALHRERVLQTTLAVAAEQLNSLLHRPTKAPLPPPPARLDLPRGPAGSPDELALRALEARPELAAAAARVGAGQSRADLARRAYFPDVTLLGAYNTIHQERALQPFVGLQFEVPLQLGRRRPAVAEADARLEVARSERHAIEDEVRFAVQSGLDRFEEELHVERLFRDRLLPAARGQVAAARSGFETGRNSFLALIDAQRNLLDVELGLEEARANLGRRRAELDRALGRIPGLDW